MSLKEQIEMNKNDISGSRTKNRLTVQISYAIVTDLKIDFPIVISRSVLLFIKRKNLDVVSDWHEQTRADNQKKVENSLLFMYAI